VKASFGEAKHGSLENLSTAVGTGLDLNLRHEAGKMNERSFIVKSPVM
jgi:hypothetical protein